MNILYKFITYVSPEQGLKRAATRQKLQILGNMTAYTGASRQRRALSVWFPLLSSAYGDTEPSRKMLVARSRDAFRNQLVARAAIKRMATNVVGIGLRLNATVDHQFLGLSDQQGEELERTLERKFALWANSVEADIERQLTFAQMQNLIFINMLQSGDCFANTAYFSRKGSPFELKIGIIESDLVSNPNNLPDTHTLTAGIELSPIGEVIAYYIANQHANDPRGGAQQWRRLEAFGKNTGRRRALQLFDKERPGYVRVIPLLAPIIEPLKQLSRYTDAELMAAVISGMLNVFIKTPANDAEPMLGNEENPNITQDSNLKLGYGSVMELGEGESVELVNPTRPNTAYDGFVTALFKQIGAALELPMDELMLHYSASYSAARAAMLQAWKMYETRRTFLATQFCDPIYKLFVDELVATGQISIANYADYEVRQAVTACNWIGQARGSINEAADVAAAVNRIEAGLSTRAIEAAKLGLDSDDLDRQRAREEKTQPIEKPPIHNR